MGLFHSPSGRVEPKRGEEIAPTYFGRVGWAVSALTDHFSGVWWACVEDSLSHPTLQAIPKTGRYFGTIP